MDNYKQDILSIEQFKVERPDLAVHTDSEIQSCINTTAGMLNSECGGLIEKCWYETDTTSQYYRSDWEKTQIVEAFIVQTQYTLNMANDFTQGGGSYSMGNINQSYSRPENRDPIGPGVLKLLANARVYNLQIYNLGLSNKNEPEYLDPYFQEPVTRDIGDKRYIMSEQTQIPENYVPVVGPDKIIDWKAFPQTEDFQNKLVAGENITLTPNGDNTTTIKASGGGGTVQWGSIEGELDHQVDLYEKLVDMSNSINTKQEKLTAGDNITIDGDFVISATGGGSSNALEFWSATKTYMKGDLVLKMFPVQQNANGVDLKLFGKQTALLVSSRIDNNIGHEPTSYNDNFWDAEQFSQPLIAGGDGISLRNDYLNSPLILNLDMKYSQVLFFGNDSATYKLDEFVLWPDSLGGTKYNLYKSLIKDNNEPPWMVPEYWEKITIGSGGGTVDPNDPLLKNNFANVLGPNLLAPRQALNTGDILLNATSGKVTRETDELHSRVNIGWESRVDNNKNAVPTSTVFVDTNWDKLSAIVMGGINTIIGVNHVDGSSAEPAWDIVPANAITFDMSEVKSSNIIKYYKATSYGNNWGEVTNVRIYPETDPNIVALVKKVDGQLNDPDGIDGKIIYFGEEIEKVKVKQNRAIMFYKSTVTTFINQNEFNTFKDTYNVREGDYLYVTTAGLIQVQWLKDIWNEFL